MMTLKERNWQVAVQWFYNGGRDGMTKNQQVEFLINECGYPEATAYEVVGVPMKNAYTVVVESEGGAGRDLIDFDSADEARKFCDQHDWVWVDGNNFHWEMCIRNNRI